MTKSISVSFVSRTTASAHKTSMPFSSGLPMRVLPSLSLIIVPSEFLRNEYFNGRYITSVSGSLSQFAFWARFLA